MITSDYLPHQVLNYYGRAESRDVMHQYDVAL